MQNKKLIPVAMLVAFGALFLLKTTNTTTTQTSNPLATKETALSSALDTSSVPQQKAEQTQAAPSPETATATKEPAQKEATAHERDLLVQLLRELKLLQKSTPTTEEKDEMKVAIQSTVRAQMPKIKACYEEALAKNESLGGRVSFAFSIVEREGEGRIDEGEVVETETESPFFEMCVLQALSQGSFPVPEDGKLEVTYPFVFASE